MSDCCQWGCCHAVSCEQVGTGVTQTFAPSLPAAGLLTRLCARLCGVSVPLPADMDGELPPDVAAALSPNATGEEAGGWASSDGSEAVHLAVRCVMTSAYMAIITVGLLGNITLVKIFVTTSAMRSVPNIFISSLAAGDLLLLVTCVPVDAFRYFSEEWVFGEAACKLIPVIQLTSVGVSVFTLTALSADR